MWQMRGRIHDSDLLDALEELDPEPFTGSSFRIVPEGGDPVQARLTGSGGRWDDGQFPVLYTSMDSETAIAEVKYHLSRQPIFSSKMNLLLYELEVVTRRTLKFLDVEELIQLGVDASNYCVPDYSHAKKNCLPEHTGNRIGGAFSGVRWAHRSECARRREQSVAIHGPSSWRLSAESR